MDGRFFAYLNKLRRMPWRTEKLPQEESLMSAVSVHGGHCVAYETPGEREE